MISERWRYVARQVYISNDAVSNPIARLLILDAQLGEIKGA